MDHAFPMSELTRISLSLPLELELNTAFLAYCAGMDARVDWDLGGISGYDDYSDEIDLGPIYDFVNKMKTGASPPRHELVALSVQMFNEYWAGEPVIEKYFPGYHFIFVVGPPRTGGTYLLTRLYEAAGIDHTTLNRWVLRDTIPRTRHMARRRSDHKADINGVFELFQFLVWAKDCLPSNVVIQKNTRYANWTHILDKVFGNQASYAVTVRPPLPCMASFIQWLKNIEDWNAFLQSTSASLDKACFPTELVDLYDTAYYRHSGTGILDVILGIWEMNYCDIVQHACAGEIIPVLYGDPMVSLYENHFAGNLNAAGNSLEWTPDDRDYGTFINKFDVDQDATVAAIANTKSFWAERGHKFPDIAVF